MFGCLRTPEAASAGVASIKNTLSVLIGLFPFLTGRMFLMNFSKNFSGAPGSQILSYDFDRFGGYAA
jgi:hypothetical protein